jgi:putative SOS response-associated peptidase YedK
VWTCHPIFVSPCVEGLNVGRGCMGNIRPRYNAAPSQELLVIRRNHKTGERSLDLIEWD